MRDSWQLCRAGRHHTAYIDDVKSGLKNVAFPARRDALERLYSAGARRFAVWDLCAGEAVPLAHTLNNLMNTVNAILQGIRALDARQNALRDFTKTFVVSGLLQHCLHFRRH